MWKASCFSLGGGGRAGVCGKGPEALLHFERCWERMQMRCK